MSAESYKVLRIFIGSPSDLDDDRERVQKAVSEVSETKAKPLGFELEVRDWSEVHRTGGSPPMGPITPVGGLPEIVGGGGVGSPATGIHRST